MMKKVESRLILTSLAPLELSHTFKMKRPRAIGKVGMVTWSLVADSGSMQVPTTSQAHCSHSQPVSSV